MSKHTISNMKTSERRVYVLPRDLLRRLNDYVATHNCQSEVNAVRRLLVAALDLSESGDDLEYRVRAGSLTIAELLASMSMHSQVTHIEKSSSEVTITHRDGHSFSVQVPA